MNERYGSKERNNNRRVLHESSEGFCNECSLCQECSNLLDDNYCALLDLGIGQCFVSRGKITEIKTEEEKK